MQTAPAPSVAQALAYQIKDAAAIAGLSRTTLYELMGAGELPSIKVGARRLILRADLEAYFGRVKAEAA